MTNPTPVAVRRCYNSFHPVHAAHYFAPEHDDEFEAIGLERGPMAYFAGRAAAFGAVGAGVVSATFYNFNPALVAEKIPRAWTYASPETVLRTRLRIADSCLTRLLGPEALASRAMAEAADLAMAATAGCGRPGRPLYSAHADLPVPESAHMRLWYAATLLREHRGDGHLVALGEAELDGLEALVSHTATGTAWRPQYLQANRGWTAHDWSDAQDRLRDRGLLDTAGELTDAGMELRRALEAETDRLGFAPYALLGAEATKRLTELAGAFTKTVLAGGGLPLREMGKG
ncbi:SCO6745 family protein [Kitasatospora indigofera]|uniref:SCO6745 family protein n=1 Tax=Kitasatospora indigofera TaxID=67307 RepID=UPI0033A9DBDF